MEQIFLCVLNMSISAGYVILAVLLARLLLRRAPKKYSYALWLVVAFRFCCPVSFRSVFSLFRLVFFDTGATLQFVPMDIGMMPQPEVNVGIGSANAIINSALPAATPQYSANPMQIWLIIAALIWCAGIALMLLWFLLRHGLLCFRLRTATRLEGNVFESERVDAPFAMGLFRPRIYLPYGLDAETQRHVLAHERWHLRHGDHILRQLAFLILALHWFNPLCWLAYILMGRDMELRCDEGVLARGGHDPADYSTALLRFAAPRRFPSPGPLTFGEPAASQRIRNALRWTKPKRWVTVIAVVAVIAVVLGCAANPAANPVLLDGAEISHATNDNTGEVLSVEAVMSLVELLRGSDYGLYTGRDPWDSANDDWVTLWCTDGSRYELHYWYCSGFSFHPAHFGEDDYYSILTHYNAEGEVTRRWKLEYDFDAEYRLWRGLHSEGVPFSIRVGNVEMPLETKWFEDGTFDFDYDFVPIVTVSGDVQLVVSRDAEELLVGVDHYKKRGTGTVIVQETHTLKRAADGRFVLDISLKPGEYAVFFIPGDGGKYIFKVMRSDTLVVGSANDIQFSLRVDGVEMPVVPVKTADTRAVYGYRNPPEVIVPQTGTLLIEAEGEELVLAEQYRPRNSVSYSKHHLLQKGTDGRFALDLDLEDGQFSIFWLQVGDEAYTFQIRVDRSVANRYFTVDEVVQQCAVYSSVYRMEDAPQYCLTPDGQLLEQRPGEDWRSLGQMEEVDLSTQEWDDLFRFNEDGVGWTESYSVGWFRGFNSHTWLIGEGEGTHYLLQQWDGRFYLLPCVYDEETGDSWARWTLRLTLVD